jgi:putative FmdB family regulatory protein
MPIYDYKCTDCGTVYDIFHKVREVPEDIICPSCTSAMHTRLLSAPNISMKAQKPGLPGRNLLPEGDGQSTPPCGDASCCGGTCSLN